MKKKHKKQSCPFCKPAFFEALKSIDSNAEEQKKNTLAIQRESTPDALKPIYDVLYERAVQDGRLAEGQPLGIRRHRHDYFLPKYSAIVEFDEAQHFTLARKLALEDYPFPVSFPIEIWIEACTRFKRTDRDPPHRDEQRAWLDTIRDYAYLQDSGLKTTIRVAEFEMAFCQEPRDSIVQLVNSRLKALM